MMLDLVGPEKYTICKPKHASLISRTSLIALAGLYSNDLNQVADQRFLLKQWFAGLLGLLILAGSESLVQVKFRVMFGHFPPPASEGSKAPRLTKDHHKEVTTSRTRCFLRVHICHLCTEQ